MEVIFYLVLVLATVTTSHAAGNSTAPSSHVKPSSSAHVKPSSSAAASSSMKPAPSKTTSTAPASSSKAPTAKPTIKPTTPTGKVVTLALKDKSNKICIEVNGTIDFTVHYTTKGKVKDTVQFSLMSGKVTGQCKTNKTANIKVAFGKFYSFGMTFKFDDKNSWSTSNMSVSINTEKNPTFPNATSKLIMGYVQSSSNLDLYKANNKSYKCNDDKTVELTDGITIDFKHVQIQPFTLANGKFADASMCMSKNEENKGNSIVPIAVGCALAGLIIIVLIAYLIGRRRSHRGYQQV